jgi:hypothetical protein
MIVSLAIGGWWRRGSLMVKSMTACAGMEFIHVRRPWLETPLRHTLRSLLQFSGDLFGVLLMALKDFKASL